MEQLMMFRKTAPVPDIKMPEGWTIRPIKADEGAAWSEICGNEFWNADEMPGEERWQKVMCDDPNVLAGNVFVACDETGKPVATAAARLLPVDQIGKYPPSAHGIGYLHFVAAMPLCRGKGAGSAVTAKVLTRLMEMGLPDCVLVTNDYRLAAIKSYLRLGWVPVLSDSGMRGRWEAVRKGLGLQSLAAMELDGSAAEPIAGEIDKNGGAAPI